MALGYRLTKENNMRSALIPICGLLAIGLLAGCDDNSSSSMTLRRVKDPVDDTTTTVASASSFEGPGQIYFRCRRNELEVYVSVGSHDNPVSSQDVNFRFGQGNPQQAHWDVSTDETSVFADKPAEFVKTALAADKFAIRVPLKSGDTTSVFDLKDGHDQMTLVAADCGLLK
jgi:hypothetical protein